MYFIKRRMTKEEIFLANRTIEERFGSIAVMIYDHAKLKTIYKNVVNAKNESILAQHIQKEKTLFDLVFFFCS